MAFPQYLTPKKTRQIGAVLTALGISAALLTPTSAFAKTVTATVSMKKFRGPPAYVAVYLTDPAGAYHSTLAVRGGKSKYRRHLRGWFRGVAQAGGQVDGVSGASVGSGRSFSVQANVADALLKSGYKVVVDASVEDAGDYPAEAVVSLDAGIAEASARGRGFVDAVVIAH